MPKKVLVAMSGGVDSSVATALLKEQGDFVAGAYMKNFSPESWQGVIAAECPWEEDVADAKAVCEKLGIEFRSFNFENEYREKVIDYFFREYAAGRTPNPDVMCNKEIKFDLFLKKALELGFDYIATGHYARINRVNNAPLSPLNLRGDEGELYELLKGVDNNKDQSYFLYQLNQFQLAHSHFPVGEYTKPEVRELARKFGLPNSEKKDSQGLCFVGHINLREFLKTRIPEREGELVSTTGEVIGTHRGAAYYTVGQRQGLGVGGGVPYYVTAKDVENNRVVVAPGRSQPPLYSESLELTNVHWIDPSLTTNSRSQISGQLECSAKIRYRQEDQECTIFPSPGDPPARRLEASADWRAGGEGQGEVEKVMVTFKNPQFAVAPGQSVVFYKDDKVLGGGIISRALNMA